LPQAGAAFFAAPPVGRQGPTGEMTPCGAVTT